MLCRDTENQLDSFWCRSHNCGNGRLTHPATQPISFDNLILCRLCRRYLILPDLSYRTKIELEIECPLAIEHIRLHFRA